VVSGLVAVVTSSSRPHLSPMRTTATHSQFKIARLPRGS
jgi:hypothetical protein